MELGEMLQKARNESDLTQEKAAEALQVSRQTLSNWENGKTYPDILNALRMSELYSMSLDSLLKEETNEGQCYKAYLAESTDIVRSHRRLSITVLSAVVLGVWVLSLITFFLLKDSLGAAGYCIAIAWAVLPITFFSVSYLTGYQDYFGKFKWLLPVIFSVLFALSGSVSSMNIENALYRSVVWPDFTKLPIGFAVSAVGIGTGALHRKMQRHKRAER